MWSLCKKNKAKFFFGLQYNNILIKFGPSEKKVWPPLVYIYEKHLYKVQTLNDLPPNDAIAFLRGGL